MSANHENNSERVEDSVAAEKAANDAIKEDEKADLVSDSCQIFCLMKISQPKYNFNSFCSF